MAQDSRLMVGVSFSGGCLGIFRPIRMILIIPGYSQVCCPAFLLGSSFFRFSINDIQKVSFCFELWEMILFLSHSDLPDVLCSICYSIDIVYLFDFNVLIVFSLLLVYHVKLVVCYLHLLIIQQLLVHFWIIEYVCCVERNRGSIVPEVWKYI